MLYWLVCFAFEMLSATTAKFHYNFQLLICISNVICVSNWQMKLKQKENCQSYLCSHANGLRCFVMLLFAVYWQWLHLFVPSATTRSLWWLIPAVLLCGQSTWKITKWRRIDNSPRNKKLFINHQHSAELHKYKLSFIPSLSCKECFHNIFGDSRECPDNYIIL